MYKINIGVKYFKNVFITILLPIINLNIKKIYNIKYNCLCLIKKKNI